MSTVCNYSEEMLLQMSDEDLAELCKTDNRAFPYLTARFTKLVLTKAYSFALKNLTDADDYLQDGMLALLKAAETYDRTKGASFATYADVCVTNKMKNTAAKHIPETDEISDEEDYGQSEPSPEDILIEREKMKELYNTISNLLSQKEWQIFRLFLDACSYSEIASDLKISEKSVDNALMRTRRKLKAAFPKIF